MGVGCWVIGQRERGMGDGGHKFTSRRGAETAAREDGTANPFAAPPGAHYIPFTPQTRRSGKDARPGRPSPQRK